jgi:hypothetical protein
MRFPTNRLSRVSRPAHVALLLLALALVQRPTAAQEEPLFRRGDVNASGLVDIADPIALLGCLFLGSACPGCPDAADANDDGTLDLSDSSYALSWLFLGGRAPPSPGPQRCGPDPTADRLGPCRYSLPGCEVKPEPTEDPRTVDVLSRLHYASVAVIDGEREEVDESDSRSTATFPRRATPYDPRPGPAYSWNSPAGRSYTGVVGGFNLDRESHSHLDPSSPESQILTSIGHVCVEPDYHVSAGDRTFSAWPGIKFQAPANAFATKAESQAFLMKVHAEQPFFLPFSDPDVRLGHGWYYSGADGGLHRACDYSRTGVEQDEDPTFEVRSSSWGKVAAVIWDHNAGNTVAVEHVASGGQRVMIIYMHLRNGRANDVALAKSSTSNDDKYVKYRAFAKNFPNHLSWGTEDHVIQVQVGDDVAPGTLIGYAGNTGAGGAGSGLNADGSPENWRGNVHLHVYFAVPHPTTVGAWVWVDPYGVYDKVDTGCYDLLKDTQFSRLYAPFYPTFHGVPYEIVAYYFGYYPDMGYKLRTLSVHRKDNQLLVSGSFQRGIEGDWLVQGYMTAEDFDAKANAYWQSGFIPRETTVVKTLGGSPRYNVIWRKAEAGEHFEHRGAQTNAQWSDLWQERVIEDEWRLEDYVAYTVNGSTRHSALVTSHEGRPFLFSGLSTSAELDALIDEYKADGFLPVNVNVAELAGDTQVSGIFRQVPGCWKVFWGRTPAQYQALVTQYVSLGYRVWKLQGYANSGRYAVIFTKDAGPCS